MYFVMLLYSSAESILEDLREDVLEMHGHVPVGMGREFRQEEDALVMVKRTQK